MSNKHKGLQSSKGMFGAETRADSINVGHGNFVLISRIVAILESGSLPMKRLREKALENNMLVDATAGRKTRSLVITDSGHILLSALAPQTLQERLSERKPWVSPAQLELESGEFFS